ncbi:hypothetical protein JP75_07820 [Devosia riboflavina]|uniref:Uncharacterized protein n=1 Tax=Devosia riboflavina TaxID=46914 RepID=A0A087M3J8_9HYPH|nr:hypothetical protein [Devosia riboflavina]KFL31451.1 hypothetical protein JP75_07820 [Devosia riboflavina]
MATTVVFEGHPSKIDGNPFDVVTPFGKVQTISVGDSCEAEELFREALGEILDGPLDARLMQSVAQKAIDAYDALTSAAFKEAKAAQAGAA